MVDMFSRRVYTMHVLAIIVCKSALKIKILEVENSDQQYMEIKEKLRQGNL